MPTPEHQPQDPPADLPDAETLDGTNTLPEQNQQRYKTIAVRVEEQTHLQLQFIAQLGGTSISEEIRTAIQGRIDAAQDDPKLIERAQRVREKIEREAAARTAAIAGFIGMPAVAAVETSAPSSRTARRSKSADPKGE